MIGQPALRKNAVEVMTREHWLENRGILGNRGASTVAAALGYDPFCTPLRDYAFARREISGPDESLPMRLGKMLEPVTASLYEETTGRATVDLGDYAIIRHPDLPWLFATLDRLAVHEVIEESDAELTRSGNYEGAVELKSTGSYGRKDWSEGEPPIQYQVQNQVQLYCADLTWGSLAALVGNAHFFVYDFDRKPELEEEILKRLDAARNRILRGEPPDATHMDKDTLFELHPNDNGQTVIGTDEDVAMVEEWQALKRIVDNTENEADTLKMQIAQRIGDATFLSLNGVVVSYKTQSRSTKAQVEDKYLHILDGQGIPYQPGNTTDYRVMRVGK